MRQQGQSQIEPNHRNRLAIVYIRQSSVPQSCDLASLDAQRAQSAHARAWGWLESAIQVIEEDVGRGGTSTEDRPGYRRLLREIELGRIRLVLVSDLSRLSRSQVELRRLLNLCRRMDTLVAERGVALDLFDPFKTVGEMQ